ncbi:MAG: glycosyltransferase family 2 protein [Deltaproteobacteria bacterium]|nr:glycosyltransferase family 2 protein [Deltaproteobacteria bacterium]
MAGHPKISVIMPSFNRGHTIRRAIDSVLAQDFQDFELIVVDEHSTDGTAEILAEYGDRIRVIKEYAKGVARARNLGIAAARGEYLCYCDSDDEQLPYRLSTQAAVLDRLPEVPLVFCDSFIWENGERVTSDSLLRARWIGPTDRSFDEDLAFHFSHHGTAATLGLPVPPELAGRGVHHGSIDGWLCAIHAAWGHSQMHRTKVVRAVGGHWEALRCYEDWELSGKISKHHPLAYVDIPLVRYRVHQGEQLTGTPRPNAESYLENLFHTWRADRIYYTKYKATIDRAIGVGYAVLGEVEARAGNFERSEECFRRAIYEGPIVGKRAFVSLLLSALKSRVPLLRSGLLGDRIPAYLAHPESRK